MKIIIESIDNVIALSNYNFLPLIDRIANNYAEEYKESKLYAKNIKVDYEGYINYGLIKFIVDEGIISNIAAIVVTYPGIKDDIIRFSTECKTVKDYIQNLIDKTIKDSDIELLRLKNEIKETEDKLKFLKMQLPKLELTVSGMNAIIEK